MSVTGLRDAYTWAGLTTPVWLFVAAVALGRALGVQAGSPRELLLGGLMLVTPGVPQALLARIGIFHPQDVAATAAVLVALAAAVCLRWLAAGLWLGAALAFRQWALLALLPVIAAAPCRRTRAVVLASAAALFAAVVTPFLVADPEGTATGLSAWYTDAKPYSLVAHLGIPEGLRYAVSRGGPLLGAALVAGALGRRWREGVPLGPSSKGR